MMSSWPGSATHGYCETWPGGQPVYTEGTRRPASSSCCPGRCPCTVGWRTPRWRPGRTNQRGVYSGATQSFVKGLSELPYWGSVRAVTDCDFWVIGAAEFGEKFREWFPMAMHLLEGLTMGFRSSQVIIGQRERLLSLGRLSAGLTHELNNPAAAAVRATATRCGNWSAEIRRKLVHLATADVDPKALVALTDLQEAAVENDGQGGETYHLWRSARLKTKSPAGSMIMASTMDGIWHPRWSPPAWTTEWLDEVAGDRTRHLLADGLHWVTYALETEQLMGEIEDSDRPDLTRWSQRPSNIRRWIGRRIKTSTSVTD